MSACSIPVQAVCNSLLKKSFEENISITPMKLQKLLYFVYREYLQKYSIELFTERFEVWQYGPVLPSVYSEFRSFHSSRITQFAKNANGSATVVSENGSGRVVIDVINTVWNRYKYYSGIELSKLTHKPGTAWYKAFVQKESTLKMQDIKNEQTTS